MVTRFPAIPQSLRTLFKEGKSSGNLTTDDESHIPDTVLSELSVLVSILTVLEIRGNKGTN